MRRTYISPEYYSNSVYGSFNMLEESNFFGSKMLEIEDSISIENDDIIYYQKLNNEQIDFSLESSLESYIYSSSIDKKSNHLLSIDESQSSYQLDKNTKWILVINWKKILENYLFANIKKSRTFEGIKNEMVISDDVNIAIRKYINLNVLNRYRYKSVELYVDYKDMRSNSTLKYQNEWNDNITKDKLLPRTQVDILDENIKLSFNQEKYSSEYNFSYYFNIIFEKI